MLGSVSGTLAAHYTLFVHLDYGYSMVLSGIGFAFLNAGSVLGRPAWGLINDRLLKGREYIGFLLINLMNALVFALFVLFYRFTEVPAVWIILAATFMPVFLREDGREYFLQQYPETQIEAIPVCRQA